MKKITMLILFFVCAIGFSQTNAKAIGSKDPVSFKKEKQIKNDDRSRSTFGLSETRSATALKEVSQPSRKLNGKASFTPSVNTWGASINAPAGTASKNVQSNSLNNNLVPVVITHSVSQNIVAGSITCNAAGIPTENSFYRDFDLDGDFGISGDFNVTNVEFGVEQVTGAVALTLNVYSTAGPFPTGFPGSLTLQGTANYSVNLPDNLTIVSVPLIATIPAGSIMVYELKINAGATNSFFPGSNAAGQTGVSWIAATDCSITAPTNLADIGFPNVHMIMNVVGEEAGGGGGGNEWTVTIEDTANFGDEVTWELRDNLGAVILSGGPYGGPPYTDTQMVTTANEPLEFYIEFIGTFGDNTPAYTVSCSGEVVVQGVLVGGTESTESGLVCPGGGGGPCANAIIEVNQDFTDTCMAFINQGGLAQSYMPTEAQSAGAGIMFTTTSSGLDVNLSLWDGLPNAGGTMLASGTSQTDGTIWADVFWDPVVNVTVGSTYYIVIDGDVALPCVAGSLSDIYAGGNVFANNYSSFPQFDYTFRTYSCDGGGGGGPCAQDNPENAFENGYTTSSDQAQRIAFDITVPADTDFTLNTATVDIWTNPGSTIISSDISFHSDLAGTPGALINNQAAVIPTSQAVIGSNFGFDISEVVFDITPEMLAGQAGVETTYWVVFTPTISSGSGFISSTTASIEGFDAFFSPDAGVTWIIIAGNDIVYNFEGQCDPLGGGATYDDCAGAIALSCGDSVTGETLTATDSGGNPAPDVFYKFTGTGTPQSVTISLCGGGTDYDSFLRVYDDCDLLNELAANDDSCGLQSEVTFFSDGTSTYYIMVEGFGSGSGNFSLDVTCINPPANDLCSNAIAVGCGDSITGTTIGSTLDTNVAGDCGTTLTAPGVWYSLADTSGLAGSITISLCAATDFDSKISVYTGDCGAPPLTCVAGNDDSCGLQSEVTFPTNGNTTFLILVHGFGGATGNFSLDVNCTPTPPPNDMIVNSIDVDEIGFPYTDPSVAMPAATTENGNPQGCDLTGANGVWYNFVAAGDGTAIASIVTPGGASSVTFYTAPDESSTETDLVLVPQNSNQCAPGTSTSIFTLGGQAYYVFVLNSGAITDIVIDGTNLSVSDNTIEGFSYYPNPTNGILNLKSVENIENVSLYNLLGQIVIDNRVNATTSLVDISGLSTGTYLMKVTVNGQIGTYRVLKQ